MRWPSLQSHEGQRQEKNYLSKQPTLTPFCQKNIINKTATFPKHMSRTICGHGLFLDWQ